MPTRRRIQPLEDSVEVVSRSGIEPIEEDLGLFRNDLHAHLGC